MIKMFIVGIVFILSCPVFAGTVSLTGDEINKAEKDARYQKYDLVCKVCNSTKQKQLLEDFLKKDKKYAKKYGVVNYGRRDNAVQSIKWHDSVIIDGKNKFKSIYGRKFNYNECDLVNSEDCEGALFELSAKILGKVPWEPDDTYPKP